MVVLETIGLVVAVLMIMAVLTFLVTIIIRGNELGFDTEGDIGGTLVALICVLILETIIISSNFIKFYNNPEDYGYTRIEVEVEETE